MSNLKVVNVNENKLRYLPNNIGESLSITALHAISNQLMELPDRYGHRILHQDVYCL
jgi:Leucine-rich repeat (LRR) protein